ncbi:MAG: hypothetical protein KA760_13225, partial [Steroidobacteraceae bacterium]|nr:hypothetical protein [Steroidobacteraceae bacterium]
MGEVVMRVTWQAGRPDFTQDVSTVRFAQADIRFAPAFSQSGRLARRVACAHARIEVVERRVQ